jgi:hypothetical protein
VGEDHLDLAQGEVLGPAGLEVGEVIPEPVEEVSPTGVVIREGHAEAFDRLYVTGDGREIEEGLRRLLVHNDAAGLQPSVFMRALSKYMRIVWSS